MPAKVPMSLFGGKTVKQESGNTALPQNSEDVSQQNSITVKQEKATFYLDPVHSDKLEELRLEYKKRTGRRINRQDVVRRLIENCSITDLL